MNLLILSAVLSLTGPSAGQTPANESLNFAPDDWRKLPKVELKVEAAARPSFIQAFPCERFWSRRSRNSRETVPKCRRRARLPTR